ncbi:THO complex subunit 7 isoform X2 [Lycorma delicatula]|uniref:THO complex subunit 7 isoform X2 n=1 Tax=Lycorma delicatula TaxID=130591 RepID=UPI003F515433
MGDEDVIKRKLIIDGDGTGDDRRLNVLLKSFIKWCNTTNETPNERLCAAMSAAELENYNNLSKQIECDIESAKEDIAATKIRFQEAKTVRKNRVEYELLAKIINEQPDRKQTHEKLSLLQKELQNLEETRQLLEEKLDLRRKQFHVLVASIRQLQALLDENDDDNSNNKVNDPMETDEICEVEVVSTSTLEKNPLWTEVIN